MKIYVALILLFSCSHVLPHGFYGVEEVNVEIVNNGVSKTFIGPIGLLPHSNLLYIWLCKNNGYNSNKNLSDDN